MRTFSFISSIIVFFVTLFFMVTDLPVLDNLNSIIYLSLMGVLLLICFTGILINCPHVSKKLPKNLGKRQKAMMH